MATSGHRWNRESARTASARGLVTRRKTHPQRSAEYVRGYQAGWKAYERYLAKWRSTERGAA